MNHIARHSSIHTSRSTVEGTLRQQRHIAQHRSFRLKSVDHAELGATVEGIVDHNSQQKDYGAIYVRTAVFG